MEPDIAVICDKNKVDDKGCHGAPDWIIEIVSPSSKRMDYYKKLYTYADAGVREYWVVDPKRKVIVVYQLERNDIPRIYSFADIVKCSVLENFEIDFTGMIDYDYGTESEIE